MSGQNVTFENPDNLPVESLKLTVHNEGIVRPINALDPHWVEKRTLISYQRPPTGDDLIYGAIDAWKTRMGVYCNNLKWLLSMEHHRFWSTVMYHPTCTHTLVSFLQDADPPYLPPHESQEVQTLYLEIRRFVLVVFSRLCTNKESQSKWMTKEYMSEVIYDKFLFTIPIIWDLCLVYGSDNSAHVSRLVKSVFSLQPKYLNDTKTALKFVNEAFKYIILQVNKDYGSPEPPNLPETFKGFSEIRRETNRQTDKLTFSILKDLVLHMLDTAMTLRLFLQVYSEGVKIYRETNIVNSIIQIYEYGVPYLYQKLSELCDETSQSYTEVDGYIDLARVELLYVFRDMLSYYKNAVLSGEVNGTGTVSSHVECYLSLLLEVLAERLLVHDYHAICPVHEDLEVMRQAYPDIDPVKTDFILQAIYSHLDEQIPEHLQSAEHPHDSDNDTDSDTDSEDDPVPGPSTPYDYLDTQIPEIVREESAINEVKSVLPHLGEGFILKCLKHYQFDVETVVKNVLEESLDSELKDLDRTLPVIPADPLDTHFLETGNSHLNVFDGDEFDIMTRDDVDLTRIHKGKRKGKYKDATELLDDKTEIRSFADLYTKYSLVTDDAMYSDEYDDTYDTEAIAPPSADPTEELRPFVTPRALRQLEAAESSSSEEEEPRTVEAPSASYSQKNKPDFCVNPEELRARREASYQARRGKGRPGPMPSKSTDVQGKPKGQGQEKDVLVNRDKKEKHKSSRGNHNRRQGASWKRSQGMMPS